MKKQILMLAAMALTIFTSCKDEKKDDLTKAPDSQKNMELIIAEPWNLDYSLYTTLLNDSVVYQEKDSTVTKVHFLDNNTVISYMQGEPNDTSVWSLNGQTISIGFLPMDILEINNNKLTLEFEEKEVDPDFGTFKFETTIYFSR